MNTTKLLEGNSGLTAKTPHIQAICAIPDVSQTLKKAGKIGREMALYGT